MKDSHDQHAVSWKIRVIESWTKTAPQIHGNTNPICDIIILRIIVSEKNMHVVLCSIAFCPHRCP